MMRSGRAARVAPVTDDAWWSEVWPYVKENFKSKANVASQEGLLRSVRDAILQPMKQEDCRPAWLPRREWMELLRFALGKAEERGKALRQARQAGFNCVCCVCLATAA